MQSFGKFDPFGPSRDQSRAMGLLMPHVNPGDRINVQTSSWADKYEYFSRNLDILVERATGGRDV